MDKVELGVFASRYSCILGVYCRDDSAFTKDCQPFRQRLNSDFRHPNRAIALNGERGRGRETSLDHSIAFRKKIYHSLEELQHDLDEWLVVYNHQRPHSGRYCYGKTPMQTFSESKRLAEAKMIDRQQATVGQHDARAAVS